MSMTLVKADKTEIDRAFKALESLDKIRAEINKIELSGIVDEHTMFVRTAEQVKSMALEIIDKYRERSE